MYMNRQPGEVAMTERPLFRYLLAVLVLTVIFFVAVRFMDALYDDASQFKFELQSSRLTASVNFVRQSWIAKGRPSRMRLDFRTDKEKIRRLTVYVNRYGWPINVEGTMRELNCPNIWRYLAEDLSEQDEDVADVKVGIEEKENGCEFRRNVSQASGLVLIYDVYLGKVSTINKNLQLGGE